MNTAALMLAAGQSRRFDGLKQLTDIQGMPLVCHSLLQLPPALEKRYVVLGAQWQHVAQRLPPDVEVLVAPEWHKGMGHSLSHGVRQLDSRVERVLICLADQVALTRADFSQLLRCSDQHPGMTVAAYYQHRAGVPAIFCRTEFAALRQLQGDKGARSLLNSPDNPVLTCDVPRAATDIDTQQDLTNWRGTKNDSV